MCVWLYHSRDKCMVVITPKKGSDDVGPHCSSGPLYYWAFFVLASLLMASNTCSPLLSAPNCCGPILIAPNIIGPIPLAPVWWPQKKIFYGDIYNIRLAPNTCGPMLVAPNTSGPILVAPNRYSPTLSASHFFGPILLALVKVAPCWS